jgi:hypothetical protein
MSAAMDESVSAVERLATATIGVSLLVGPLPGSPHLVEGINVPIDPLHENLVLVEGASEPLQNGQNKVLNGRPNRPDKDRRCDAAAGAARQADRNHGPFQAAHGFRCIFVFLAASLSGAWS